MEGSKLCCSTVLSLLVLFLWVDMKNDGAKTDCYTICSWDVKGLNGPVKRARVFNHLNRVRCDIAFLQETHFLSRDQFRLKKGWAGHTFHSRLDSRSRGTAILAQKKIQLSATSVTLDPEGRFVIVTGSDITNQSFRN